MFPFVIRELLVLIIHAVPLLRLSIGTPRRVIFIFNGHSLNATNLNVLALVMFF